MFFFFFHSWSQHRQAPDYFQPRSHGRLASTVFFHHVCFDSETQDSWRFVPKLPFIHMAAERFPPLGCRDHYSLTKHRQPTFFFSFFFFLNIQSFPPLGDVFLTSNLVWIWFSYMPAHLRWVHMFGCICIYFPGIHWRPQRDIKQNFMISCKRQWRMSVYLAVSVYPSLL